MLFHNILCYTIYKNYYIINIPNVLQNAVENFNFSMMNVIHFYIIINDYLVTDFSKNVYVY